MVATTERNKFYELAKSFDIAMLVTKTHGTEMRGRPMAIAHIDESGLMYFATGRSTSKSGEIATDPEVAVLFQSKTEFASARGTAELVKHRQLIERFWRDAWKVWFPKGKDDPDLCLIRVDLHDGEYWDNSGVQGISYLFKAAKAYATGTKPQENSDIHGKAKL